jgi:uncharacterized membrane protein YkvI
VVVVTAFVRDVVVIAVGGLYACVQCVVKFMITVGVVVEVAVVVVGVWFMFVVVGVVSIRRNTKTSSTNTTTKHTLKGDIGNPTLNT